MAYDEITGAERIIKEIKGSDRNNSNDYSALRKLRHPGVPEIYDAFEKGSSLFVVMEFIEGRNLSEVLESEATEEFRVIGYMLDVLDTLAAMHTLKPVPVIHGDIKPGNILISENRAMLIDFGSTSGTSGSSGFCAPEKLAGFEASIQSDIYSVGQVLHYCLTGRTRKLFENNRKGITRGLHQIISRAMMKIPVDRYMSAMEMANDLKRWVKSSSGENEEGSGPVLLCFPGNPHLSCEIASVSSHSVKTLLADLDLLSPGIDMLMSLRKVKGSSHEYGYSQQVEYGYGIIPGKKEGRPDILPCLNSYDAYEDSQEGIIKRIADTYRNSYDVIIICCSGFPYDSVFMESLFVCDQIIFTVEKGPVDIRRFNALALQLSRRQGVSLKRLNLIGYGFSEKTIETRIAGISSEIRWLGCIPYRRQRMVSAMEGRTYLPVKGSRDYKSMNKILKTLEVL